MDFMEERMIKKMLEEKLREWKEQHEENDKPTEG
jgi:hypothetical protein